MAIKRSPLGRDPLEWIKVTKSDSQDETEGTATDRLTQPMSEVAKPSAPAQEKREPAPATSPPQEEAAKPEETVAKEEPQPPVQEPAPAVKIPLFEEIEAKQEKEPSAPAEPEPKPVSVEMEEVESPAPGAPSKTESLPSGGHSVSFTAPGIAQPEAVAVPREKVVDKNPEAPSETTVPSAFETPKEEDILAPAPEEEAREEAAKPERLHVGAVDLRVQRRPMPVPAPTPKAAPAEQPISFTGVLLYICILLLAILVLSAFFGNRKQVTTLRKELRDVESQVQKFTSPVQPAEFPGRK